MDFPEALTLCAEDGTDLFVHRRPGPGPSVVLNHGGTGAARPCWDGVLSSLPANWDVFAPDARGHGKSGRGPAYSWDHFVSDLSSLVERPDLAQPTLVGHSMGAATVALYASRHKDVPCVVIEAPPWWISPDRGFLRQKSVDLRRTLIDRQEKSVDWLVAHFAETFPGLSTAEHLSFAEAYKEVDPAVIGDDFLGSLPDWRNVIVQIDCPVLLIHGSTSEGAIVSPELAQEIRELNPRVEVTMVPSVGHCVSLNARDDYLGAVVPFIERHG